MPPKKGSADYRPNDSSRTRVAPFFEALASWPRRLLDLAAPKNSGRPWKDQDLTPLNYYWGDKVRKRKEYPLNPSVALLEELVRNAKLPKSGMPRATAKTIEARERLIAGDSATLEAALRGLESGQLDRKWYVFEGSSFPDVFIETPDALIIVEGKYTEAGATTKTTWMPDRDQMLRHLDGAWEIRGARSVYGLFIVDGGGASDPLAVPKKWKDASSATISAEALKSSLPHRKTLRDKQLIADCLVGITTWQAVQECFNLHPALLTKRVKR